MAKKDIVQEKEVEIQHSKMPKKSTLVTRWFDDNCTENISDIRKICDLTARKLEENFGLKIKTNNTEVYGVIFFATFITILQYIASKQKVYNNYSIEIFNSINIGYTNNDNEDNEKVGNFMPILEYIGTNQDVVRDDIGERLNEDRIQRRFTLWKTLNAKKNIEHYKEIQELAFEKLLKEFKVDMRFSECIIPIFCIFFDFIIAVLKMKYREAAGTDVAEVKLNVFGLFDIFYSFDEDKSEEIIDFEPNITTKLTLKNDSIAVRE